MSDDTDSPPEREMKDFQFRQMKKARVFDTPEDLPKERSNLLTISNKFGLTFVGLDRRFKVYQTQDILAADKADGNSNEIVDGIAVLAEVTVELTVHHLALSCDELTLSVCGMSEGAGLSLTFYDVRTFMNKTRQQKLPFASLQPAAPPGTSVQDLKWNPAQVSTLAVCLSDGSMMVLDVTDSAKVQAELPSSSGITCICWSPKGKQVAAGKMNATVSQYTPALEEKKVIPCPHFYTSSPDEPVKALDVLWLKTYVFAVVYAAADGSLETPPELVLISLPKKDEKVETKYLNFSDTVYGSCTERQHHYFLSHVEDWDLVFAASAASIEVSVIARQDDKIWELWILEDASRAELPVTESSEDTLPLGLAIDYTNQQEIHISDEKTLPPAPTMLMLSTEGLLCPFALLNLNPGVKQLVSPPNPVPLQGERLPKPGKEGSLAVQPLKVTAPIPSAPAAFPNLSLTSAAVSTPPAPAVSSSAALFSSVPTNPVSSSSSSFSFSVPSTTSATQAFSLGGSTPFGSGSSVFSFASKPPSDSPSGPSAFSFSTPSIKPPAVAAPAPVSTPQNLATASPPTTLAPASAPQSFSFNSSLPKTVVSNSSALTTTKPTASGQVFLSISFPCRQIAHFQKELDDLKARSARADFKVGSNDEMKELRKESEDLHIFTLEIKETTESLHGDIGTLKTTLLEGFAGAEEAIAQSELSKDRHYRQLLYKKPLDPRSEEQLKEIRRLYQYVMFAVEDVNDVLNVEWEKHLEKKKKQKHMVVPGREGLYTTLANNLYIIDQQKNRLEQLVKELTSLRLYNKTTTRTINSNTATETTAGMESELESLKDALLKARLDTTPPKTKSPAKISPVKQSQLRNFLSKGQMPPVRSTAPANLSRSAFLSPKYYEELDDVSSTSSLSQSLDPHPPLPMTVIPPALSNPRHPTVVRTPSIQPGFGAIQSTPLTKIHSVPGMGFGLSPIASPSNGADSTALATKTVKHRAPPTEQRTIPVTIPAQQAAATAALRRQMANQKTGKRKPLASSGNSCSFIWFLLLFIYFCFPYFSVGKDVTKFSFGGNGKVAFGQTGEEAFPLIPKSTSAALGTGSPTMSLNPPGETGKPTSTTTALRLEPQPPKTIGGETLGSFSGLRVGQGEEAKDSSAKPTPASFTFGDAGLGLGKGAAQFSFGANLQKSAEDSTGADLSKGATSGSLFRPPESNTKPAFSVPQTGSAASALPMSFSSLLAASSDSSEEPKAPQKSSDPTPPPEKEPASEPAAESISAPVVLESAGDAATTETTAAKPTPAASTPTPPVVTAAPTTDPPSSIIAPTEATTPALVSAAPTTEANAETTTSTAAPVPTLAAVAPAVVAVSQEVPAVFQVPCSDKPGSIFTQPVPATTDSSSLGVTPVINTVAQAATTPTPTIANSAATTVVSTVFGQPPAPPVSSAPSGAAAPTITGFTASGFGTSTGTAFGKSVFGPTTGFGQSASNTGTASGFSFCQSAFGSSSSSATTGGGGLFGASTVSNASSFSFGTSSANTASSTGSGLFGQSTGPAFGQSSGFGQGSVFGSNTTTSSSTGFSFGQTSAFGCSSATPVFGQQTNSGSVFGQPSTGGSLFGSTSANAAGSSAGGGFFSGLGGKPTEEAANKNPFGTTSSTGGFGQSAQTGTSSLFGNSGAKSFAFGQSSFGEQKPSGTFTTGGGSVASQGFGSFSTPTKPGGFGSAPVFGSPPSFGGSPAFGGAASFGSSPSFSNTLGSSAGKVFGEGTAAANMGGFGFASPSSAPSFGALASQSTPSFGSLAQQGSGFGTQPTGFSGFGQQPQAGGETTI
uniref:Nuclear pore complex protein Nup214 n=1 Tax=Echeneis naucrates TaxID=173247 RepID=A0A665WPM8_ECHNA